jgi:hypothetical protein
MTTYAERPTIAATPRVVPASKGQELRQMGYLNRP